MERCGDSKACVHRRPGSARPPDNVLGFVKKTDIPLGEARWVTVVSPDQPDGPELLLEPDNHPAARPFKEALFGDGIPFTSFAVDDVHVEAERLRGLGVRFTQQPLETES
jgi:catechol 2,3-dioxygenase-like lactoylglutathione lyase family enzyme